MLLLSLDSYTTGSTNGARTAYFSAHLSVLQPLIDSLMASNLSCINPISITLCSPGQDAFKRRTATRQNKSYIFRCSNKNNS